MPTHTRTILGLSALIAFLVAPVAIAQTVTMEDFQETKNEFEEARYSAAESTRRRSELQIFLFEFDERVEQAKRELADVNEEQDSLQKEITEKQKFIVALSEQIHSVESLRGFYQAVLARKIPEFVSLAHALFASHIARAEAGPVAGGALLRVLIKEPIGDSVERELLASAALRARALVVSEAGVLLGEARKTEERLHGVAQELTTELTALEKRRDELHSAASEKTSIINLSWKEKKLSEAELAHVTRESAEASAKLAELQADLLSIHQSLRDREVGALKDDLKKLQEESDGTQEKRDALNRRIAAIELLDAEVLRAKKRTVDERNTDTRLYKRIELRGLDLENAKDALSRGTVLTDDLTNPVRPLTDAERAKLEGGIRWLEALLALMKDGVPEDAAVDFLTATEHANAASAERKNIEDELAVLHSAFTEVGQRISAKLSEIETAEKATMLGDLPPLFVWPVKGPITAGFLDAVYETVFRVAHRAIDIAVAQGTPVKAISDGIVYAVKDGGALGYSYVLIGHRNGYASLYGHLLRFRVKKGDIVTAGDWIADSGGLPGTPGAGHMTTGAHLHLEVTKKGVHIDPRSILP